MKTLSIIGAGHVGKTLGALFHQNALFTIRDVLTTQKNSAVDAAEFIGDGAPICDIQDLKSADIFMITTPDRFIEETARNISQLDILREGNIVFHCSGSLTSSALDVLKKQGAFAASIHPVKSFAEPKKSVETFNGTYCGTEGDDEALDILIPAFDAIGAKMFSIDPDQKIMYHAAAAFLCNYLPTVMEAGFSCYQKAGLPDDLAKNIARPIVEETIRNIFDTDPKQALTGPIARGDLEIVEKHKNTLSAYDPDLERLYDILGKSTAKLAGRS